MAAVVGIADTGATALTLTAATAQTVIQITAPTNQDVELVEMSLSFNGSSSTAVPAVVNLCRQTTTGTSSTTITPVLADSRLSTTIQTTAKTTFSAEPTTGDVLWRQFVPTYQGLIVKAEDFLAPVIITHGTRLGVVVTAPAGCDCRATIRFRE
jgi:hypothetical protein